MNPNDALKFLYCRAIQGHSGSTTNPASHDNVLIPEGFTEFIFCHVGKGKELRSIVNHGLIQYMQTSQAVSFTVVNPRDNQDGLGETLCDLSKARIVPYKNTWKHFQDAVFWCNLKLAQQRELQFYQTKSKAICIEDQGLALSKGKRDAKIARFSQSHFAEWFTSSACTRSKIILGIATRCGELRRNPKQNN